MTQQPSQPPAGPAQGKPRATFDDFTKLDIRVAKVLEVKDHPNADKLFCLTIDLGGERRQIIAGLRPYMPAEALLGRNIIVVTNLEPRKMRGLESNGMLLAASFGEGDNRKVVALTTGGDAPPGSPIS
jgi:methionyl-tRNA synthetase